jgi:hypothetical protein
MKGRFDHISAHLRFDQKRIFQTTFTSVNFESSARESMFEDTNPRDERILCVGEELSESSFFRLKIIGLTPDASSLLLRRNISTGGLLE